jgi:hypothetical protein
MINAVYSTDETKPRPMVLDPELPIVGRLQPGKFIFEMDDRV